MKIKTRVNLWLSAYCELDTFAVVKNSEKFIFLNTWVFPKKSRKKFAQVIDSHIQIPKKEVFKKGGYGKGCCREVPHVRTLNFYIYT